MRHIAVAVMAGVMVITSCSSGKGSNASSDKSERAVTLGAVGELKTGLFEEPFRVKGYPVLKNKVRVEVSIREKQKAQKKNTANVSGTEKKRIKAKDSLPAEKKFYADIRLTDVATYLEELGKEYNQPIANLLRETHKNGLISEVTLRLSEEQLQKIMQAGTFYWVTKSEKNYQLLLYTNGQHTETLYLDKEQATGFKTACFCWTETAGGNWSIADITPKGSSCPGKTSRKAFRKKKNKSLFRM